MTTSRISIIGKGGYGPEVFVGTFVRVSHRCACRGLDRTLPRQVHRITVPSYDAAVAASDTNRSGDFDRAAEVEAVVADGTALERGAVRRFVCTVVRVSARQPAACRNCRKY